MKDCICHEHKPECDCEPSEQKPFVPKFEPVSDEQIATLAQMRYDFVQMRDGIFEIAVGHQGEVVVERHDCGAFVSARVFMPATLLNLHGCYDPTPIEEDEYMPGPRMNALLTGAREDFVEDIRRGCNMAMLDNANYKAPLWERVAKHTLTLLCAMGVAAYVAHGIGYKTGVGDTLRLTIQMLHAEPSKVQ